MIPDAFVFEHPSIVIAMVFLASAIVSLLLTGAVQKLAVRFGIVRQPTSARHVHTVAIPRVGGLAVFLTVTGLLLTARYAGGAYGAAAAAVRGLGSVLLPAGLLFAVGLVDDLRELPATVKLGAQIGAAVWLWMLGYSVLGAGYLPGQGGVVRLVGLMGTIVWVVWITNAVNLIDGLDGLAAGTSLLSLGTLLCCACVHGNQPAVLGTALLGGAVVGFLRHNFNPASIFLGDGGSLFIGFMLSALGLMGTTHGHSASVVGIALPALAFGLPLSEVVLSVSRRFLSRKRLFAPDRMHIHHRLLDSGLNHRQAVLVLYAVGTAFGMAALLLIHPTWYSCVVALWILLVLCIAGTVKLRYPEFAELALLPRRTLQQRRVIANTVVVGRAVTLLEEAGTLAQIRHALEQGFPAECFAEMRLKLAPRVPLSVTSIDLFLETAEAFVVRSSVHGHPEENKCARLVMDVKSRVYQGTLEFVVSDCSHGLLLNLNQVFQKLHPALNAAMDRLSQDGGAVPREHRAKQPLVMPGGLQAMPSLLQSVN